MRLLGAVLAGGQSRRFGSDKAEAMIGGRRLLDCAAAALSAYVDDVIVVGRVEAAYVSVDDVPAPGLGPLGGICAALLHAGCSGYDRVLTMPCDVPVLPEDVAKALIAGPPSVLASQPVVGCWPAAMGRQLEAYLASGGRRAVRAWCETAGARLLEFPALANINTPEDLRRR